jgi:hypothetical protein
MGATLYSRKTYNEAPYGKWAGGYCFDQGAAFRDNYNPYGLMWIMRETLDSNELSWWQLDDALKEAGLKDEMEDITTAGADLLLLFIQKKAGEMHRQKTWKTRIGKKKTNLTPEQRKETEERTQELIMFLHKITATKDTIVWSV